MKNNTDKEVSRFALFFGLVLFVLALLVAGALDKNEAEETASYWKEQTR